MWRSQTSISCYPVDDMNLRRFRKSGQQTLMFAIAYYVIEQLFVLFISRFLSFNGFDLTVGENTVAQQEIEKTKFRVHDFNELRPLALHLKEQGFLV